MQDALPGNKGSTMHVVFFVEHSKLDGQGEASDNTKDIKVNVVIARHDFLLPLLNIL